MKLFEIRNLEWQQKPHELSCHAIYEYVIRPHYDKYRLTMFRYGKRQEMVDFNHSKEAMIFAQNHHEKALSRFLKHWGNGADLKVEHDNC